MDGSPKKDLISVIVPIYKVDTYLNQCIESLIRQTYKNLEIILVDDGSPDLCGKICDDWAAKDSRVVVIHQENGGLSNARNAGMRICRGRYLMFVDGDDYVEKEYVERLYQSIVEHQADVAMCGFTYLRDDGHRQEVLLQEANTVLGKLDAFLGLESSGERKIAFTVMWNKIYKRELCDMLQCPEGTLCEDEFVLPRVYENCNKVTLVREPLYIYRKREGSITAGQDEAFMNAQLASMAEREKIYLRIGVRELLVLQQIHMYGMLNYFHIRDTERLKAVQKKVRKYYFTYKYAAKPPAIRRWKDILAVLSLSFYHKLVNIK